MAQMLDYSPETAFADRRLSHVGSPQHERRQFVDGHDELSPEARELANAIDGYKLRHRRRFISHEELLSVIRGMGYQK